MISMEAVRAVVETHWSEHFILVPTAYAEQRLDADRAPAWAELWVSSTDDRLRRAGGPDRIDLTVTVHLFVRDVDTGRLAERLIDSARAAIDGVDLIAETVRISLRELAVRDLSRRQAETDLRAVRHVVVIARGVAEEICPVMA